MRRGNVGANTMLNTDHIEHLEVAHGFNEELTIILNSATIAADLLGPEHPANDAILELKRSATRCTELSRKLTARRATHIVRFINKPQP